jgi:hypothetical protein
MEEKPRGKQQARLKLRALAMRKMRRKGNGVRAVAKTFGVSVRTVQREMKRRRSMFSVPGIRAG